MKSCNVKYKIFGFLLAIFSFSLFVFHLSTANAAVPVWIVGFDKCTEFQNTHEQFQVDLHTFLTTNKHLAERAAQMRDIQKAREDVNKLVATVYNELRTQQIVLNFGELRDVLHSVGIVVVDQNRETGELTSGDEICKAAYQVKAEVDGRQQCVAVAQEARFITNADDYIYEESRRRAMDMLFCYLGDWRHFPIGPINDSLNCEQLGLDKRCRVPEVWQALGQQLFGDPNQYDDVDGNQSPLEINDDQHIHNLCEGMRALGKKCVQDMHRDIIKYGQIDKITRKDRTIILAPPQTWYTPERCRIIDSFLPKSDQSLVSPGHKTPYTKNIKSLQLVGNPDNLNSSEALDFWFGSRFGNPTLPKQPSDMSVAEYSVEKELEALSKAENNFSGLSSKVEKLTNDIISQFTELRKQQYVAGEGLRDATLRIGWRDYEWNAKGDFLEKYAALDQPVADRKKPNKIFKPLPCYWPDPLTFCEITPAFPDASPTGAYFYFDTGLVISPIIFTKDKIQSAIQAQFDLAQKAFDDRPLINPVSGFGSCGAAGELILTLEEFLPAPWEDTDVNLAEAINPLTDEPYTFGTPGPFNPPYRIPGVASNYFNFFYNDVFQLYHTAFPDVLAGWFRVNAPGYDSIYGLLENPIVFGPGGSPGSGPPGGGGSGGGGGGGGSGTGECKPIFDAANPCSVQNLEQTCFGDNAEKASAICNVESGGNPFVASGVDICQPSGPPVSWGLFQINISAHDMTSPTGQALNCAPPPRPAAFTSTYTASNKSCSIDDQDLFNQCRAAATNAELNIQKACQISSNGQNWSAWGANSKCKFTAG